MRGRKSNAEATERVVDNYNDGGEAKERDQLRFLRVNAKISIVSSLGDRTGLPPMRRFTYLSVQRGGPGRYHAPFKIGLVSRNN